LTPRGAPLPWRAAAAQLVEIAATTSVSLCVKLAEFTRVTMWSRSLLAADLQYGLLAQRRSPYLAGGFERHLLARRQGGGTDDYIFGETPWFTAQRLLRRARLRPGEHLIDIGSGDGRVVLFAALRFEAHASGFELIAERHQQAQRVVRARGLESSITLVHGDGLAADLSSADVLYCAWTCFSADNRRRLLDAIEALRPGARLITVTHPIDDARLKPLGAERAWFGWGRSDVFYYQRQGARRGARG